MAIQDDLNTLQTYLDSISTQVANGATVIKPADLNNALATIKAILDQLATTA